MELKTLVPISWVVHLIACHYLFRHIRDNLARLILTLVPCVLLTYIGCRDLPRFDMSSLVITSTYWIISMRIVHLTVFSPNDSRTFYSFIFKVFWTLFPLKAVQPKDKQWPLICDFLLGCIKLLLNHWIIRWLLNCEPNENYLRILLIATMVLTSSFITDILISLVRLVTRDKYTLLSISNNPLLSTSLSEFWGRRYNRLTSTIFRESIFQPVSSYLSSPTLGALATFIFSGLLHAHLAVVLFKDVYSAVPTFAFFILHGFVCCVEKQLAIRLPAPLGWLTTHLFLFVTLPLCIGPTARQGPAYFDLNHPLLFDAQWIPKLPLPNFCL